VHRVTRWFHVGLSWILLALIGMYRFLLSPLFAVLGARCRFYPTCSAYAAESVKKYGALAGGVRAARRLARCHPGHPGGVDFP